MLQDKVIICSVFKNNKKYMFLSNWGKRMNLSVRFDFLPTVDTF